MSSLPPRGPAPRAAPGPSSDRTREPVVLLVCAVTSRSDVRSQTICRVPEAGGPCRISWGVFRPPFLRHMSDAVLPSGGRTSPRRAVTRASAPALGRPPPGAACPQACLPYGPSLGSGLLWAPVREPRGLAPGWKRPLARCSASRPAVRRCRLRPADAACAPRPPGPHPARSRN